MTEIRITIKRVGKKIHVEADSDARDTTQLTICASLDDVLDQIRDTLEDDDFGLVLP